MDQKLVIHFQDGSILKGISHDFFPSKDRFHLGPLHQAAGEKPVEISVSKLKAVFFVKDFLGDQSYREVKNFSEVNDSTYGKKISVHFKDGEIICGFTQGYSPNRTGFFLFPADPRSNNRKVFIIQSFVEKVEQEP